MLDVVYDQLGEGLHVGAKDDDGFRAYRLQAVDQRPVSLAAAVALFAAPPQSSQAADKPTSTKPMPHEFVLVQIVPGKRIEFVEFLKKEYFPLQAKDNNLKSIRYYIEDRAQWALVLDLAYEDYAAVGRSQTRFKEIVAEKYPDPKDQVAFLNRFRSYVAGRDHMFFYDSPEMTK